jgi:hypothetical protein
MFWNRKPSPEKKAELLGGALLEYVPDTTKWLLSLVHDELNANPDDAVALKVLLELFVFYMHILDRMAFNALGAQQKTLFNERLIVIVANGITTQLHHDLSAVETVAKLRDTYNRRQSEYAKYKLVPDADENLKNSLTWQFGKTLFHLCVHSSDLADLMRITDLLSMATIPFVKKAKEILAA